MGINNFRNFETVVIRELNQNTKVIIYDKKTVYVRTKYITYAFNRWFHRERGFYAKSWEPFVDFVKKKKDIDLNDIIRVARSLNIVCSAGRMPDLTGKEIKTIN